MHVVSFIIIHRLRTLSTNIPTVFDMIIITKNYNLPR